MNGITELALLLKERENGTAYEPVLGEILELPNIKIKLSDRIILTSDYIKSIIDLYEKNSEGQYLHNGKTAVLLPYSNGQKFIVIGVIHDVS